MALWTPYAQDTALDLSKSSVSERTSPIPAETAPYSHTMRLFYSTDTSTQQTYGYQYQPGIFHTVPEVSYHVPEVSPTSVDSWSHIKPRVSSPPDSVALDFYETELLSEDQEYQIFERDALQAMAEKNGGTLLFNNPRMRREVQSNQAGADDSYRSQRAKNNYAAKQSRDKRKLREIRLALQVTYLKKKVAELKASLATGVCGRCRHICEC